AGPVLVEPLECQPGVFFPADETEGTRAVRLLGPARSRLDVRAVESERGRERQLGEEVALGRVDLDGEGRRVGDRDAAQVPGFAGQDVVGADDVAEVLPGD